MRWALSVLVLVSLSPAAGADPVKDAQEAMKRGVAAKERGDLEGALAGFQEAIRLVPEAPVPYRYSGETLEQLGRYQEAVASYETYIRLRPESQDAAAVKEQIEKIRRERLEGGVDVACTPRGAQVLVDDATAPAGVTPLKGLQLAAGKHTLHVQAPGYTSRSIDVEVVAGSTLVLPCELGRVPPLAPVENPRLVAPAPPPDDRSPRWYRRWWVWAGAAAVVGGAAVYFATRSDLPDTDGGELHVP